MIMFAELMGNLFGFGWNDMIHRLPCSVINACAGYQQHCPGDQMG